MSRPRSGWRLSAVAAEGFATASNGRWTSVAIIVLLSWSIGASTVLDARAVSEIKDDEASWIEQGGLVLVASNRQSDGLDASRCEALRSLAGVDAAVGLTRRVVGTTATNVPGRQLPVTYVTPGIWAVLEEPEVEVGRVGIGDSLAQSVGVTDSSWLELVGQRSAEVVVDQETGRTAPTGDIPSGRFSTHPISASVLGDIYADSIFLVRAPTGRVEQCIVRVSPGQRSALRASLPDLLGTSGVPATVADRLVSAGPEQFQERLSARSTQWLGALFGGIVALVWLLVRWTRRSSDALYRTLALDRPSLVLLRWIEWLTLLAIGMVWGLATAVAGEIAVGAEGLPIGMSALRETVVVTGVSSALVALSLLMPAPSPLAALKDR